MSLASKLSAGLLSVACVCSLAAAEVISLNEPADFVNAQFKPATQLVKDGDALALTMKGPYFVLYSAKKVTLDPGKKYTISFDYRLKEGEKAGIFYAGFAPFDAKGRQIQVISVNVVKNTETIVAKAAKKGDTVVYLKDASKWDMKTPYGYIVFDAKKDYADLPNYNFAAVPKNNIKQDGDVWAITLKTPLKKDVAEGTAVRQHRSGSTYIYSYIKRLTPQEWVSGKGSIDGVVSKFGMNSKKLWAGTASVRVLIMVQGGKKGSVIEFKNIKVKEAE